MHRKAIGAEPFGQMVHHPVVVERELQAERLAQQRDPADLPLGKLAFERGAEVVTGDDAHPGRGPIVISSAWKGSGNGAGFSEPAAARNAAAGGDPRHASP